MKIVNKLPASIFVTFALSLIGVNTSLAQQSTLEIATAVNEYRSERETEIVQNFIELLSLANDSAKLEEVTYCVFKNISAASNIIYLSFFSSHAHAR